MIELFKLKEDPSTTILPPLPKEAMAEKFSYGVYFDTYFERDDKEDGLSKPFIKLIDYWRCVISSPPSDVDSNFEAYNEKAIALQHEYYERIQKGELEPLVDEEINARFKEIAQEYLNHESSKTR